MVCFLYILGALQCICLIPQYVHDRLRVISCANTLINVCMSSVSPAKKKVLVYCRCWIHDLQIDLLIHDLQIDLLIHDLHIDLLIHDLQFDLLIHDLQITVLSILLD